MTPSTYREIALALRAGRSVPEAAFDALLPERIRAVSQRFWTPLAVARVGAMWLDEHAVGDVLDVGAGPGKFCIAAALLDQSDRVYIGLEHRPELVAAATALADAFGVSARVRFVQGTLTDADPLPLAAAYYLFNPFGENIAPDAEHFDATVELTDARFARDVAATERLLLRAPVGTHALIYHGFGGRMPGHYEPVCIDYDLPNMLRLWTKRAAHWRAS